MINTELALADMENSRQSVLKLLRQSKSGNKEALLEKETLEKIKEHLDLGLPIRILSLI